MPVLEGVGVGGGPGELCPTDLYSEAYGILRFKAYCFLKNFQKCTTLK